MKVPAFLVFHLALLWMRVAGHDLIIDTDHDAEPMKHERSLTGSPISRGQELLSDIANVLKSSLSTIDGAILHDKLAGHYVTARLRDADGAWSAPELAAISEELLPSDVSILDAEALIDNAAAALSNNKYFLRALGRLSVKELKRFQEQRDDSELPSVVANAMFLQYLTKAVYEDWMLLAVLKGIFVPARDLLLGGIDLSFFEELKILSVEAAVDAVIQFHQAGAVDPDFGQFLLPMNIAEAVSGDIAVDNFDNAKAGTVLQFNKPGEKPTRFSDNGKAVLLSHPKPKLWADLYQVWNMAFISQFPDWIYLYSKLVIPQVSNYEDDPEAYMYSRVIALYIVIHETNFGYVDNLMKGLPLYVSDWFDPELTSVFSSVNLKSAKNYANSVGWDFWDEL